jgi:hypothetical protein
MQLGSRSISSDEFEPRAWVHSVRVFEKVALAKQAKILKTAPAVSSPVSCLAN